jgi:hypothetical protein
MELRVGGEDQPHPPVGLFGGAQAGSGQAERLLEEAESVLKEQAAVLT